MNHTVMMTLILCLAAATSVGQPGGDAGTTDQEKSSLSETKEVLEKAEAALKKVRHVSYEGRYEGTGWVTQYIATVEGSAMLGETAEHNIPRFRCEVKLTPPGSEETVELAAGCDGDVFFLIDSKSKTVYADIDEAVLGTHSQNLQRLLLNDFVDDEPLSHLSESLEAGKLELKESVEVGGEPCHVVRAVQSETREVIWHISKNDWLPRRVDRIYREPERGEGTTQLVLTNLTAKSEFSPAPFKLSVPDGYRKTDDFAP